VSQNRKIVFLVMGIKPGPKRIAKSTGKPDRRQRDNKSTPGNTPSLKPHIHKKGDWSKSLWITFQIAHTIG